MPKIKIDHVISFSSEDSVHVANNILLADPAKKWKCSKPGEVSANIVLQLEKAYNITSIDIGNENSAYIELLVARSSTNDEYKPLLVMSSFMTPLEARQNTNINKVRMFKLEDLSNPERNEKWDRIKIVCTQPFNRHVQYGVSFINLYSSEAKSEENKTVQSQMIGKFTLRPDSPDHISTGSLFAKRKEILKDEVLKGAAAIREASTSKTLAEYGTPTVKKKIKIVPNSSKKPSQDTEDKPKPRNRDELLYSKDEDEKNEKIDKLVAMKAKEEEEKLELREKEIEERKKKEQRLKEEKEREKRAKAAEDREKKAKTGTPKQERKKEGNSDSAKKLDTPRESNKRKHDDSGSSSVKKQKPSVQTKPFGKLLDGVTIVISGILNPDRANLRTSARSLGAKYKPDWDNSCTHLICAYANTPKFNQVKGKGKIVTRKWIEDCYRDRKRYPWRRYALDKADKTGNESEDEIWEKVDTPPASPKDNGGDTEDEIEAIINSTKKKRKASTDTEDEIEGIKNSETPKVKKITKQAKNGSSSTSFQKADLNDSETDDDLQIISSNGNKEDDVYIIDTDLEDIPELSSPNIVPKFKDFFNKKTFYIDSTFSSDQIQFLRRYIVAYKGVLLDDPTENIDFIITVSANVENVKEINSSAICVSPQWISEVHNKQRLVSMDNYILT